MKVHVDMTRAGAPFDDRWLFKHICGVCGSPLRCCYLKEDTPEFRSIECAKDGMHEGFIKAATGWDLYKQGRNPYLSNRLGSYQERRLGDD